MEFKDFCEQAEIEITVTIKVNDEVAYSATTYDIDNAIEGLGSAERHSVIKNKLEEQFEDLPEPDYVTEHDYEVAEEIRDGLREDGIAL